jgi:hypothetical protein
MARMAVPCGRPTGANPIQKRTEMRIHHVERHLYGVEVKGLRVGSPKDAQVYAETLMTCEATAVLRIPT